jgi:hypothetical protein
MRRRLISLAEPVSPFVVAACAWKALSLLGPFPRAVYLADRVIVFSHHPSTVKAQLKNHAAEAT